MPEKNKPTSYIQPDFHDSDGPSLEYTTDLQRQLLLKNALAGKDALIDKLILESWSQVDILYEEAKNVAPWPKGGPSKRKEHVTTYYKARQGQFPAIRKWMLNDSGLFNPRQDKELFDFRVELFRKIVCFFFGCDVPKRKMRPKIIKLAQKLKSTNLPQ